MWRHQSLAASYRALRDVWRRSALALVSLALFGSGCEGDPFGANSDVTTDRFVESPPTTVDSSRNSGNAEDSDSSGSRTVIIPSNQTETIKVDDLTASINAKQGDLKASIRKLSEAILASSVTFSKAGQVFDALRPLNEPKTVKIESQSNTSATHETNVTIELPDTQSSAATTSYVAVLFPRGGDSALLVLIPVRELLTSSATAVSFQTMSADFTVGLITNADAALPSNVTVSRKIEDLLQQPPTPLASTTTLQSTTTTTLPSTLQTPPKAWGSSLLIGSANAGDAKSPRLAFDKSGNGFAVWDQADGAGTSVMASRYTVSGGWQTPIEIDGSNLTAGLPEIAFDQSGNAFVVWMQNNGLAFDVAARFYDRIGGWQATTVIDSVAGTAGNPRIAFDNVGNAFAIWNQQTVGRDDVWAARYIAGAGWQAATAIETENLGAAVDAHIAFDPNGNAIAVWYQNDGTRYNVWSNRYLAGSGWQTAALLESDNTGHAMQVNVAIDKDGNAYAVWQQADGVTNSIYASRFVNGAGWQARTLLETHPTAPAGQPKIAIDAQGNAIVVWFQYTSSYDNIWASRYVAGSGWETATLIETDDTGHAYSPVIAFDYEGNAVAAWWHTTGGTFAIRSNRYVAGSGWQADETLEAAAFPLRFPYVAVDAQGNVTVTWERTNTFRSIWGKRFD